MTSKDQNTVVGGQYSTAMAEDGVSSLSSETTNDKDGEVRDGADGQSDRSNVSDVISNPYRNQDVRADHELTPAETGVPDDKDPAKKDDTEAEEVQTPDSDPDDLNDDDDDGSAAAADEEATKFKSSI